MIYPPVGMTGRGDLNNDEMAVVDVVLGLSGLKGVEIIDAGVFLEMIITNPMLAVLTIGERLAEIIAEEAGERSVGRTRLCSDI